VTVANALYRAAAKPFTATEKTRSGTRENLLLLSLRRTSKPTSQGTSVHRRTRLLADKRICFFGSIWKSLNWFIPFSASESLLVEKANCSG